MIWKRKQKRLKQKVINFLSLFVLFLQTIFALYALGVGVFHSFPMKQWKHSQWIGFYLLIPSVTLWLIARIQLGVHCTLFPVANTLITQGIYSKFRHPIYLFSMFIIIGYSLLLKNESWILSLIIIIPIQYFRAYRESINLSSKFGESYERYVNNVWI